MQPGVRCQREGSGWARVGNLSHERGVRVRCPRQARGGNMAAGDGGHARHMSQAPIEAVLAGTKSFAVALLAPLTARVGNRPRVAGDPGQVLSLCSGPSALAVIEFTGEGSLQAMQALVRDGRGVRIVAGLPPAHASAEGTLRALGVEVVQWDGRKVDGVVAAVERVVALMSGAGPVPRPAAAPAPAPRPPAPGAPRAPGVPPAPAAGAPAPLPPAAAATAAAPARPLPPGPPSAARPTAAPSIARPSTSPAQTPAITPSPAKPAMAARASVPPVPASAPRAAAASPAAPISAGPPIAPPPASRPVTDRPPPPGAAASSPAPAATAAGPSAQPRPPARFFDDLGGDVSVDVADLGDQQPAPPGPTDFHSAGVYLPARADPDVAWPAGICTAAEAEDALRRALHGTADPARPLHSLATRTLGTLSELERSVLSREPQAIDATPIRRAALMRLRVADGLASAPAAGSPVDMAALSGVLGDIDGLLAEVGSLLSSVPPELFPALEAIRNSLVSEAIDFSEAAQRAAAAGAAAPRPAAAPRASTARVLSFDSQRDVALDSAERRRRWIGLSVLGLVLALAVGYHGWRQISRADVHAQPTLPGAPSNTVASGVPGKVQLVISRTGKFDPAELQRFKTEQELRGNRVEVVSPGVLKVTHATEPKK